MFRTVSFEPELERWVRQIEENPPHAFPVALSAALRYRVPEERLYLAAALAAARSLAYLCQSASCQPHEILALSSASRVAQRLDAAESSLPLRQVLTELNLTLQQPDYGPYRLPECPPIAEASPEETAARFVEDVDRRSLFLADHRLVALARDLPPEELRRLLFRVALPRAVDSSSHGNHAVLYLAQVWRLMEWLGFEHRATLLRPLVHLLASMPHVPPGFDAARALARSHRLGQASEGEPGDSEAIAALRGALAECAPGEQAAAVARALAAGLAREDAWRAVSLAATDQLLTIDAADDPAVTLYSGTTVNALRWLASGEERPAQILTLLQAANCLADMAARMRGLERRWPVPAYPRAEDRTAAPMGDPAALLAALPAALAAGQTGRATALTQRYGEAGGDPEPLLRCLAHTAASAPGGVLHPLQQFQAMAEEFESGLGPDRWTHLVAIARYAAHYAASPDAA
jgi:hypothetical protein